MIDLHCHILPGIDDGAQNLDEALGLCRRAVEDGITHMVATPHIHEGRYNNTPATISHALKELRHGLSEHGIELEVRAAAEVRIGAELMATVPAKQVPFLGTWNGQKVMLLELPHDQVPPYTMNLVNWLKSQKILPMIAHPERNKGVMADIGKLHPLIEAGCLFQLTAMSVAGKFGGPAHDIASEMLRKGWATIIASDAHNLQHRPPVLSEAVDAAAELVGEQEAQNLVLHNPAKLIGIEVSQCA